MTYDNETGTKPGTRPHHEGGAGDVASPTPRGGDVTGAPIQRGEPRPGDRIDIWPPGKLNKAPSKGWTYLGERDGSWVVAREDVQTTADPKSTWRKTEEQDG